MSIHLIAAYVPDGAVVRCTAPNAIIEGRFHRESCLLVAEGLCLTLTQVTLLEIVRFPYEEELEEEEAHPAAGPCTDESGPKACNGSSTWYSACATLSTAVIPTSSP